MAKRVTQRTFEAAKQASVSQLLMKAGRLVNERGVARVPSEPGSPRLRPSHTALLPHIGPEGTRMSTLAERLAVSKQAVSQLVADMEAMGVVRRVPDPSDARARLVVLAEDGPTMLMRGMRILATIDAELEGELGESRYAGLRRALLLVIARLEAP